MASSVQNSLASNSPVAPPSLQEITRKLSVHNRPTKSQPITANASVSGTESDSDPFFSPDHSPLAGTHFPGGSHPHPIPHPHGHAHSHSMSVGLSTSASSKPLSSIAERRSGSGDDDSDEEEDPECDEEWPQENDHNHEAQKKRPDDDSVIKMGYLWKKGERRKTWKKRWFVLRPAQLAFYKSSAEYQLLRLLDLSDVHSCTPVALKRHANSFVLVSPTRTYYLQAQSDKDMQDWVERLNETREALLGTSTQNSIATPPIPIPATPSGSRHPNAPSYSPTATLSGGGAVTPSPPSARSIGFAGPVTSESESEDMNAGAEPASVGSVNTSPSKAQTSKDQHGSKVLLSAYMMKCRSKRRGWRKRWFVLTNEKLMYSASHMDTKRQRSIDLSQVIDALEYDFSHGAPSSSSATTSGEHSNAHPHERDAANGALGSGGSSGGQYTFKIVTTKRSLLLCAPSEAEEIKWLSAVRALIARRANPAGGTIQGAEGVASGGGVKASTSMARKRSASGASALALTKDDHQHH
ncbi:PH-domain-containing protein [Phellopilus nigrolimitatus]|nr:PH-domain-containing protein [Phellopilus nigrolimitatus]